MLTTITLHLLVTIRLNVDLANNTVVLIKLMLAKSDISSVVLVW